MTEKISGDEGRLGGKVAIVTGGTGGIGRSVCKSLIREGVSLTIVDTNQSVIDEFIVELERDISSSISAKQPLGLALDVRSEKDMEKMSHQTMERFGQIDILVNCAGILRGKGSGPKTLAQVSTEDWDEVIGVNLTGTFLSNRAVLLAMIQQRRGHIINFSSTSGLKGRVFDSVYSSSKFGVIGMSEALAKEVRQYGIRVHVVMPDAVDTPMWDQNGPIRAPEGSLSPERMANLVCFLVTLPEDTILSNLVILPFQTRRRQKNAK